MTEEKLADFIEKLADELDHLAVEPSVGTTRVDGCNHVDMTIGVVVNDEDQFEALGHGAAVIHQGFGSIGMENGVVFQVLAGLRTSVTMLQPA